MMQRACAAALLHHGETRITAFGDSEDDQAALSLISSLGAQVRMGSENITIISTGIHPKTDNLNCGESGLSARLFTSLAALSDRELTITGRDSLMQRPMHFFTKVLPQLGVSVTDTNGLFPLTLHGPMKAVTTELDGSLSSQFISGILMAFSYLNPEDVKLRVTNLNSKPYIDMTLSVLKAFGWNNIENHNYESFYFSRQTKPIKTTIDYKVETDWSNGALCLAVAALHSNCNIQGLDIKSVQGDKAILNVLRSNINLSKEQWTISPHLPEFNFDATHHPDLFPPLSIMAAVANGISVIKGVHRLINKESNRLISILHVLETMGVPARFIGDELIIEGGKSIQGGKISSHHDHRIAMMAAILATKADSPTEIIHAEAVNKSFPSFWNLLKQLGAKLEFSA